MMMRKASDTITTFFICVLQFTTYKIQTVNSNIYYPFVFNEMKGLTNNSNRVQVNDIEHALKGHMKDGYTVKLHFLNHNHNIVCFTLY